MLYAEGIKMEIERIGTIHGSLGHVKCFVVHCNIGQMLEAEGESDDFV